MFVDSHCHLDKLNYDDLHINIEDVINKAKQANVKELLSVGVTLDSFPNMLEMIEPYENVYASCGVHPLDVESAFSMETLRRYASHERVVAIGETGLDYHYKPETAALQKERFEQQVELAVELNKPLIIHTRNAREDTLTFYVMVARINVVVSFIALLKIFPLPKLLWIWVFISRFQAS